MQKVARVPTPLTHDPEDVAWALTTAEAMWNRGDRHDAVKWVRRAADAAREAKATERAAELVRAGNELATIAEQSPSISRLDVVPRSRPPSFLPTHHPEVPEVPPMPAPPIVPIPVVSLDEPRVEATDPSSGAPANVSSDAGRRVTRPSGPENFSITTKFLEETRPAPQVAPAPSDAPPPVRAAQTTVVVDPPEGPASVEAAAPIVADRLPETTPPPPVVAAESPSKAPREANPNATAQWSVAEALARVAAVSQAAAISTAPTASDSGERTTLVSATPATVAADAVPDLSDLNGPSDPLETTTEVRAMLRNAALAEASRDATGRDAVVEPTTGEHRSVPPPAPSTDVKAEPPPSLTLDSRASVPARPGARSSLRTSQAVHVVLWKDAQGVHIAPTGTVVSAIAIEALIVPLDPNADLSAWLLPGDR
jgi:hypothetical protein